MQNILRSTKIDKISLRAAYLQLRNHIVSNKQAKVSLQILKRQQCSQTEQTNRLYEYFLKKFKKNRGQHSRIPQYEPVNEENFTPESIQNNMKVCVSCCNGNFQFFMKRDKNVVPVFFLESQNFSQKINQTICAIRNYGSGCIILAKKIVNNQIQQGFEQIEACKARGIEYVIKNAYFRLTNQKQLKIKVSMVQLQTKKLIRISMRMPPKTRASFLREVKSVYKLYQIKESEIDKIYAKEFSQLYKQTLQSKKRNKTSMALNGLHRCKFSGSGVYVSLARLVVPYHRKFIIRQYFESDLQRRIKIFEYFQQINFMDILSLTSETTNNFVMVRSKASQSRDIISNIDKYLIDEDIKFDCLPLQFLLNISNEDKWRFEKQDLIKNSFFLYSITKKGQLDKFKGKLNSIKQQKQKHLNTQINQIQQTMKKLQQASKEYSKLQKKKKRMKRQKTETQMKYYQMKPVFETYQLRQQIKFFKYRKISFQQLGVNTQKCLFDTAGDLRLNIFLFVVFAIYGVLVKNKES